MTLRSRAHAFYYDDTVQGHDIELTGTTTANGSRFAVWWGITDITTYGY